MAQKAKRHNQLNHARQMRYLDKGVVMLPTKREEYKSKKKK